METLLTPIDIRHTYVLRKEGIHTLDSYSRTALLKVKIPTWLRKVGILTLRRAILEWSLRKVGIWTK